MPAINLDGLLRILESADPAASANAAILYTKDVAGVTEFFAMVSDGTIYQITPTLSLAAAAPSTIIPDDVAAPGVAVTAARADHVHGITAAAPGAILPDDVPAEGGAAAFSRADHIHGITTDSAVTITDSANTEGAAATFSRSDHTHSHGARGGGSLHALFSSVAGGFVGAPAVAHPARALNTTFQPSAARQTLVIYSVRVTGSASVLGGQTGRIELVSDAGSPPVTVQCSAGGGVTAALVSATTTFSEGVLVYLVPEGHNVRLNTVDEVGVPTYALNLVTEITL